MKPSLLAVVLVLVFGLASCQETGIYLGGQAAKPIKKIVSLSPSTTEILGTLMVDERIVGRTSSCDTPIQVKRAAVVVEGTKPNYEKIAELQPDLIVYDAKLFSQGDIDKFKQFKGAKVMGLDAQTVSDLQEYLLEVGSVCGAVTMASKKADEIYAVSQTAIGAASGTKPKVAVVAGFGGSLTVAGTGSFLADAVKLSGGQCVGPDGDIFLPMAPESFLQSDPNIILATTGTAAAMLKDPRFQSVTAVRNKKVFDVDPSILLRTGPRVKGLISNLSSLILKSRAASGAGN